MGSDSNSYDSYGDSGIDSDAHSDGNSDSGSDGMVMVSHGVDGGERDNVSNNDNFFLYW